MLQMRDVFYTILVVWILWRVFNSIRNHRAKQGNSVNNPFQNNKQREGETSIDYAPPIKKKISDDEGEYVDYEDVK